MWTGVFKCLLGGPQVHASRHHQVVEQAKAIRSRSDMWRCSTSCYITGAIAFVDEITSADLWSPVEKNVDLIKVGRDASPRGCVCPHLMTKSPLLTTPTISLTHNCTRMLHARLQRIWWKRKMGVVWCGSLDSKGNPGNFSTKGDGGSHMLRLDDINTYQQSTFCRSDSNSTLNNCVRQSSARARQPRRS